jgi:SPP1 family predicted phage head-tail adaptor
MAYNPPTRFDTPLYLLKPTVKTANGVTRKVYPKKYTDGKCFFGSFRTFGGTEADINGVYSVKNTAVIETWFNPEITGDCQIALSDGQTYEIIADPEDIEQRHQYMKFKVERVKGGA